MSPARSGKSADSTSANFTDVSILTSFELVRVEKRRGKLYWCQLLEDWGDWRILASSCSYLTLLIGADGRWPVEGRRGRREEEEGS